MADSYVAFRDEHLAEHRTAFNRWSLVIGDLLQLAGIVTTLRRKWRTGGILLAAGYATVIAGHIREGNLPRSFETARAHPLWTVRADAAVARALFAGFA